MNLSEPLLRTFRKLARKLWVEKQAAKAYLIFTSAIRTGLKRDLESIDFDKINLERTDEVAFFPEFYSRDYRTTLHGVIAHGLNYRGVGSIFVFDNNSLDVSRGYSSRYDDEQVRRAKQNREFTEVMNLPSVFLDEIDYDSSIENKQIKPIIKNYAEATALRELRVAKIDYDNPEHDNLVKRYKHTGRVAWEVTDKLHEKYDFDYIVSTGSAYLPRRISIEFAKRNDISITASSDPVYGDGNDLMFSRMDGPQTHYISNFAWEKIKNRSLTPEQEQELNQFMNDRIDTVEQTQYADPDRTPDVSEDDETYSMYTHLPWDAAIQGVSRIFDNQYEWVSETVRYFESLDEKELIIKIHPAEKMRGTEEGITDVLKPLFNDLPENVRTLKPDTDIYPYELMKASDVVLVYTSTVGMEATYLDTPVITSADGHYAEKGFTYDPTTEEEYNDLLTQSSDKLELDENRVNLVRKYLFNYFIQRPINFDLVQPTPYSSNQSIVQDLNTAADLKPGQNNSLDHICKAIIENTTYFYTKSH